MRDQDRFRGCLIGGAAGDALGYAVEVLREGQIFRRYGERGITEYDLTGGGVMRVAPIGLYFNDRKKDTRDICRFAAEIDEQDTHQIIVIGAAANVPHNAIADHLMDEISTFVEMNTEAEILDEQRENVNSEYSE